jgi:hypothetical protein
MKSCLRRFVTAWMPLHGAGITVMCEYKPREARKNKSTNPTHEIPAAAAALDAQSLTVPRPSMLTAGIPDAVILWVFHCGQHAVRDAMQPV